MVNKDLCSAIAAMVNRAATLKRFADGTVAHETSMPRPLDPPVGPTEPTGEIDLRAIGAALRRRRRAWALPTLLAFLGVGIFVTLVTPRYTAQTQILLENQETFFTRPDRVNLPNEMSSQLDEAAVASQVQLVASPDIARRAIKALHLEDNDEFDPLADGMNPLTRVLVLIGILPDPTRETAEARMVQTFEQKLTVYSPPKTRVVTIEFTSRDPRLAARGANEVAALYLQQQSAAKRGMAQDSAEALAKQIADLRTKLADADAARERYRLSSGLLAGTNNMTISGQSLADINTDLSRARATQADAQAKAATIRELLSQGRAADVADVTNSPIVRQLWSQRSTAQAQLATEGRTLLPEHPRVKELAAQLKEYDIALKSAAKQAATSLENDAKVAGQRVANLEVAVAQQKKLVGTANSDEVHLNALDRVSQSFKDQLQSSTTKYEEAMARQSSTATPADARVISSAAPPQDPSYPKKLPFLIFGTLATLVFSVGWVVASEILSGRADLGAPVVREAPVQVAAASRAPAQAGRPLGASPRRRAADAVPAAARDTGVADFWADTTPPPSGPASPPTRAPAPSASRPGLSKGLDLLRKLGGAREDDDVVLAPVPPRAAAQPKFGRVGPRRWAEGAMATLAAYVVAFGRSASESRIEPSSASPSTGPRDDFGWDPVLAAPAPGPAGAEEAANGPVDSDAHEAVAQRIVAGHVPGRGLHVVGTAVGPETAASDKLIALARSLADKGRTIIVDLNATPAKLAPLGAREGRPTVATLDGLSELLAGEASFAEVIHRDHATRLHFIPTGRKEADFRDFDLILDALTETYDFIVLLTPAYPQSEIAKVMAPYADFVVLSSADAADAAVLEALEGELSAAGAREVLMAGTGMPNGEPSRVMA